MACTPSPIFPYAVSKIISRRGNFFLVSCVKVTPLPSGSFTSQSNTSINSFSRILEKELIDVLLCDVKLPDGNGVTFTQETKKKFPLLEIILLTAYGNIGDGVQAMKYGAFDYITKGDDNDKIIPLLNNAIQKAHLQKR